MLLSDFDKLAQIDNEILTLQDNLVNLYRQRAGLVKPVAKIADQPQQAASEQDVLDNWYRHLQTEWQQRGVRIPNQKVLTKKLQTATITIAVLADALDVSPSLFTMVLIPPKSTFGLSELAAARRNQPFVRYPDQYDNAKTAYQARSQRWRLLVVYDAHHGLAWGDATTILESKKYVVEGLDTRALGAYEYAIYSLQSLSPRDKDSWTWLLKDKAVQPLSVAFMSGAYRFSSDDPKGYLQSERFRPAVEIQ